MTKALEQRGFFGWFNYADDRPDVSAQTDVPGLLSISEQGYITLELDRALNLPKINSGPLFQQIHRALRDRQITGRLDGSRQNVLLERLHLDEFDLVDKSSRQRYSAQACFIGESPLDISDGKGFDHFRIELKGLEEWLHLNSIYFDLIDSNEESREVNIKCGRPTFEYHIEGADISIVTLTMPPRDLISLYPVREIMFSQETCLKYRPTSAATLNEMEEQFRRLEEFFAILLGACFRLDWPYMVQSIGSRENWYKYYFFRGTVPEFEPGLWNTWVNFSSIRDSFGPLYASWKMRREKYGPGYYLYLAGMRKTDVYAEHKFVNLIWAFESLHRRKRSEMDITDSELLTQERMRRILQKLGPPLNRIERKDIRWIKGRLKYANEPNLNERILELLRCIPLNFHETALCKFAIRCANRRNQISHLGGPKDGETYSSFYSETMSLTNALAYLFHAIMLCEIGLDEEILRKALTESPLAQTKILPALREFGLLPVTFSKNITNHS